MKRTLFLITTIAINVFILVVLAIPFATKATSANRDIVVGGAAVRLYVTGPELHRNSSHHSPTVTSVRIDNCELAVDRTTPSNRGHGAIVSMIAGADETLTARGISVGASGGNDISRVTFYDSKLDRPLCLSNAEDYARVAGPTSNVWVTFVNER